MRELPPSSFRFGNYNADIPFGVFVEDKKLLEWIKDNNPVGYSKTPSYKPNNECIAVMFDLEDHGEYWSHIPDRVFKLIPVE